MASGADDCAGAAGAGADAGAGKTAGAGCGADCGDGGVASGALTLLVVLLRRTGASSGPQRPGTDMMRCVPGGGVSSQLRGAHRSSG
eukprot:6146948-Pleurochrysis_carterae.AAC.3